MSWNDAHRHFIQITESESKQATFLKSLWYKPLSDHHILVLYSLGVCAMMNPVMPAEGWLLVTLVIYCIWMLVDDFLISHINECMSAIGNKLVTLGSSREFI